MAEASIEYGKLMHAAMRRLIHRVLSDVEVHGLPGEHHFFITFDTMHPDVEIADWLSDRYPDKMTVVIQHWYDNLDVGDDGFAVTLNFGDTPEPLYIPFDAIRTFVDPSVGFGLRFEETEQTSEIGDALVPAGDGAEQPAGAQGDASPPADHDPTEDGESPRGAAEVVSLDKFRK